MHRLVTLESKTSILHWNLDRFPLISQLYGAHSSLRDKTIGFYLLDQTRHTPIQIWAEWSYQHKMAQFMTHENPICQASKWYLPLAARHVEEPEQLQVFLWHHELAILRWDLWHHWIYETSPCLETHTCLPGYSQRVYSAKRIFIYIKH